MGRRLLPLFFAVAAPSLPSSDANPTHCGPPFPNGTSAPCGRGNQLCPFNGTGNPGMRKDNAFSQLGPYGMPVGYHIRDLTCGLNECVKLLLPPVQQQPALLHDHASKHCCCGLQSERSSLRPTPRSLPPVLPRPSRYAEQRWRCSRVGARGFSRYETLGVSAQLSPPAAVVCVLTSCCPLTAEQAPARGAVERPAVR